MRISYGACSCFINSYKEGIDLFSLYTKPEGRGKGYSKMVLRIVKRLAKRKNKTLKLSACPFADRPLSVENLTQFYQKNGFKVNGEINPYSVPLVYSPMERMNKCQKDLENFHARQMEGIR